MIAPAGFNAIQKRGRTQRLFAPLQLCREIYLHRTNLRLTTPDRQPSENKGKTPELGNQTA